MSGRIYDTMPRTLHSVKCGLALGCPPTLALALEKEI